MEVYGCGIHGFGETIGIDVDEIRVYWKIKLSNEAARQSCYRVVISEKYAQQDAVCFDTERQDGDTQRNISCKPKDGFKSTTFYTWTVTIWDQEGSEVTSPPTEFFTSYPRSSRLLPPYSMNQTYMPHSSLIFRSYFEDPDNRWKAVWLGNGGDKPIYLRKTLDLDRTPRRVIILASGLGHFNLSVNGSPASRNVLDPGWTNYHRTVQFVGYDVSEAFKSGKNAVAAHVGNGFYAGDQGDRFFWPMYEDNTYVRYGNELCFFAEIHAYYEDGTHECFHTDPSWKVRKSATTLANIYASEDHDRRMVPHGWDSAEFDDESWDSAKPVTGPRGKLHYQSQPPVRLHNTFIPKTQKTVKPGVLVYDLGQNSSIMVRVLATGPAGLAYRVKYSETIGDDGLVLMPDPLFKEFETGVYSSITLAGAGEEEWTPDFSFTSARYIQIENATLDATNNDGNLPLILSVTAHHVSSAASQLGYIKTDKADVNDLINACYWSFSSNIFSYHTDCPQIEKFGWLEVTHLLFPATQYIRDMEAVYSKILDDIIDTQEPSGLVPTMAPLNRYMCGPMHDTITWGCAVCFIPELIKKYYGSTHVFTKVYKACVQYLEYMKTKERQGGLIQHGLGDWGRDIAYGNHQANIETAVYYKCLQNVAMMARELGHTEDEARFTEAAERVYRVYNEQLLVTSRDTYPYCFYTSQDEPCSQDRTMVAQAMALQFDLVPSEHRQDIITAFLAAAEASNNTMLAGEIGLKYLWNTLAEDDVDRPDIVLAMARREEHPSYMRFLRRGETTLLEFWQDACRSKCHDMLGSIYEWFYAYALGVQPLGDGYRTWRMRPCFKGEFDLIEGEVECPYGLIKVKFDRTGGMTDKANVQLTVPAGTVCDLILPSETSRVDIRRQGSTERQGVPGLVVKLSHGSYSLDITA